MYNAIHVQYNDIFRATFKLPRDCSASEMFLLAHMDVFAAVLRKRVSSLRWSMLDNTNSIIAIGCMLLDVIIG